MKSLFVGAALAVAVSVPAMAQDEVERGKYLAEIMDCAGCHTPGIFVGKPDFSRTLAGSEVGFELPGLGVFFPRNLTPDRETGLGAWSREEIVAAIRTGARPDGRLLAPVMPWKSYSVMTDADAQALAAYLQSLPPVRNIVPEMTGSTQRPSGPYLKVVSP